MQMILHLQIALIPSNLGSGSGVFGARTGDNFAFKSITSTDGTVTTPTMQTQ